MGCGIQRSPITNKKSSDMLDESSKAFPQKKPESNFITATMNQNNSSSKLIFFNEKTN